MQFRQRTLRELADMICGNDEAKKGFFKYRSSSYLTRFFQDCDTDFTHDGSTRWSWVVGALEQILAEPQTNPPSPPDTFGTVIRLLMDQGDAVNEPPDRTKALSLLNTSLAREGFEAFYAPDKQCYLKHVSTNTVAAARANPHRPLSQPEVARREALTEYLNGALEDELIEQVLLPLFRQLGFHRVTAAGHKDRLLEYGKDLWMKFVLPTQHVLYFGVQVKKGRLDASGDSGTKNVNVAEIHNQVMMMLGHEIFDPEIGKKVLVDHAFIIAGGEITKAARNWLGNRLDATKRSQVMFMDRDDILNLFAATSLPLPPSKTNPLATADDDVPF